MKKARFVMSHFDAGVEKFKAGEDHELTDETRLCIARGAAVEVDVADQSASAKESTELQGEIGTGNATPGAASATTSAKSKK